MSHIFNRKTDSFFGALRHVGYLLMLAGLVLGTTPWWKPGDEDEQVQMLAVGVLLLLLGFLFKFTYHGFQVDFKNHRLREYLSMFGFKTGNWVPWPSFKRVVLSSSLGPADDHDHHPDQPKSLVTWYTIGLYSDNPEAAYELRTAHKADALQTLQTLAKGLNVPAEDKTLPLDPFAAR